jgi:hypothetical protein
MSPCDGLIRNYAKPGLTIFASDAARPEKQENTDTNQKLNLSLNVKSSHQRAL